MKRLPLATTLSPNRQQVQPYLALIVRSDFADLPQNSNAATHTHSHILLRLVNANHNGRCHCATVQDVCLLCNCTGCLVTLQLHRMSGTDLGITEMAGSINNSIISRGHVKKHTYSIR